MFKRRDWVYTHNPDTGDVTSDSESELEDGPGGPPPSEAESESDSESEEGCHGNASGDSYSPGEHEMVQPVRMQDLQEMMEDECESEDDEAVLLTRQRKKVAKHEHIDLDDQKSAWLQAPENTCQKGVPLRCLLCRDKLLINSSGFQSHLKSKAHLAAAKRHGILEDPLQQLERIVAAASVKIHAEETETHRERIARFQEIAESLKQKKQAGEERSNGEAQPASIKSSAQTNETTHPYPGKGVEAAGCKDNKMREKKSSKRNRRQRVPGKAGEVKRKKPGKRQRLALKTAAQQKS